MEMSSLSAASAYGASHIAQLNPAAPHALLMPDIPPGNSLAECVNFAFSDQFGKYINSSTATPPITTIGNINDYLSSCVCKIYNETFPSLKDIPSYTAKYTPPNPPRPPSNYNVYSLPKIPPIFQNISNFLFKVYIPYRENEPNRQGIGFPAEYRINFLGSAKTVIEFELDHYYANGTIPARNTFGASIWCSKQRGGDFAADVRVVAFVKDISIKYFKNMGAKVYVNGELI